MWRIGELVDRVDGVRWTWNDRWGGARQEGVRACHANDEGFGSPVEGDEVRGKGGGGAAGYVERLGSVGAGAQLCIDMGDGECGCECGGAVVSVR